MFRSLTIVAVCIGAGACGSTPSPPTGPTGPSSPPPQMACSSDVSVVGRGPTQPLTFSAPTVTGGVAPVTTVCTPASATQFAVGSTTVTCVATDAAAQTASCSFTARVAAPTLGVKQFMAVGDSLTAGENGLPIQPSFVDEPNSYPTKLRSALQAAFPGQGITVTSRGVPGQFVNQTKDALAGYLAARPEAVMLLSGYNDLTIPCHPPATINTPDCDAAVEFVEDTLRECVQVIKRTSSVRYVFLSLLTPPGPVAANATRDNRIHLSAIQALNQRIRTIATAENVVLVDSFSPFVGREAEFVSIDGLHLRTPGYQSLADTFFAMILSAVPQSNPTFIR